MNNLAELLDKSENVIIDRVIFYEKLRGYSDLVSEEPKARIMAVRGLSEALIEMLQANTEIPEFGPGDDFTAGPAADFAITMARLHIERGVTLPNFLSLMKYFRQAFMDVTRRAKFPYEEEAAYLQYILRFFDRVELAFISSWVISHESQ